MVAYVRKKLYLCMRIFKKINNLYLMNKLLFIFLLIISGYCHAEETDTITHVQLQEVSVVAVKERRQMRQQPVSVSMVDKNQLTANHITSLKGTSNLVPNMFIPDYGSRLTSAIYIRGIGSRINTPAVGLYVDNIPYIDKSAFDFNFYDIERVDVLRGPQGVLYGRNTMGGLVHVYTKNPLYYCGTNLHMGFATGDSHRNVALTHYHQFSNTLALSAGGYYEGSDGFFRNDYLDRKSDAMQSGGGHLRTVFTPSSRLTLDLNLSYDYSDEGAYPYYLLGTTSAAGYLEGMEKNIGKITNNRESSYRRSLFNAGLNIAYDADAWQMNAITAYQGISDRMFMDQDFMSPDIYTLEQRQRINTITEELTFKSKGKRYWDWITGVNFMYQSLHTDGPVKFYSDGMRWLESNVNKVLPSVDRIDLLKMMGFTGMGINFRGESLLMDGSYETPTFNMALFHQSTFHLTERFSASVGLRFDYEHQQMTYHSPANVQYGFTMPNVNNEKMAVNLQQLESHISYDGCMKDNRFKILPKIALQYDINTLSNVYASVAMGQRSGGYNLQMFSDLLQGALRVDMMDGVKKGVGDYLDVLASDPELHVPAFVPELVRGIMDENMPKFEIPTTDQVVYRPETSWNYELGTHLSLADRSLFLDAAVFYNRIFDQQIARFAPAGFGRMMVNAGKSESYGTELSCRWLPTQSLSLAASYGFTHATFLDYDDGQGRDYAGCRVPYVPMHSMDIDAAYTWHLKPGAMNLRTISVGTNVYGAGNIYWTEDNSLVQPFYATLAARLNIEAEHFGVTLWGKNLTDNVYQTFCFVSANRIFEQRSKPLQIGIDVNIKL